MEIKLGLALVFSCNGSVMWPAAGAERVMSPATLTYLGALFTDEAAGNSSGAGGTVAQSTNPDLARAVTGSAVVADGRVATTVREKPYVCTTCTKAFADKSHLNKHTRIHTGEKPYVCTTCTKAFAHKNNLDKHARIHADERPFVCSVCAKAFRQKIHLTDHLHTHDIARPFACEKCEKGFRSSRELRRHQRGLDCSIPPALGSLAASDSASNSSYSTDARPLSPTTLAYLRELFVD